MDLVLGMFCLASPVVIVTIAAVCWVWRRVKDRPADSFMIDRGC